MIIAALLTFGLLLSAWIVAPSGPRSGRTTEAALAPLAVAEAA